MTRNWPDSWVGINLKYMYEQPDELSKSIFALYLLLVEFQYGGIRHYLDTHSASEFPQLRVCFGTSGFEAGIAWLNMLEGIYGGPVDADLDTRFERIIEIHESSAEENPFAAADQALAPLIPHIESILEKLVEQKQAEVSQFGWVNRND